MKRNTLFWVSSLPVNEAVILAKLPFKFNAVLIRMPLVHLWKFSEIISKFVGNNII